MRWKAFFFLNRGDTKNNIEKKTFGFKSKNFPAQIKELRDFEDDLFNIAKSIKYRETKDTFQRKMKEDIRKLKSSKNVYVFADKTTNIYEVPPDEYKKLLKENITKTYRKSTPRLEKPLNLEAKQIAKKLELDDRIECLAKTPAFITLNVSLVEKLKLNQWKNSASVISWFKSTEEKQKCLFIQLDIMEFYPSIAETILDNAISFALQDTSTAEEDLRITKHSWKSLLHNDNEPWKKKDTDSCFDVTMAAMMEQKSVS